MTTNYMPCGAGGATPESGEAPSRDQAARGFRGDGIQDDVDRTALADPVKRLADLRSRLAERDITLVEMRDGGLLASGVGMRAHFGDLTAAEVWARRARP